MTTQQKTKAPIRFYTDSSRIHQEESLSILKKIASLGSVAEAVVVLPDMYHKSKLESPSSLATAMRNHIVFGLSSPSPNCGMAFVRTDLHSNDIDDTAIDALFKNLALKLPLKRKTPYLSINELLNYMLVGAKSAVERYELDPNTIEFMDQYGNAIQDNSANLNNILETIPNKLLDFGIREFAVIGSGNHFLELQTVEEIFDENIAHAWNLTQNQLAFMYHTDSGHLGALVGRTYAHRWKNNLRGRLYEWQIKLPFHLKTGRKHRLLHRLYYYILPRRFSLIHEDCEEAKRAILAIHAVSNYAYANRIAILAKLRDAACDLWGNLSDPMKLLWDAPHNSIRKEIVNGNRVWIHRHNAALATPPSLIPDKSPFKTTGQPVLLPGTEQTSSYLCVAGEGAASSLNSVDHGAGRSAMSLGRQIQNGNTTRLYNFTGEAVNKLPHLTDDGVIKILNTLQQNNIIQPIARLRPLAVLKDRR